LINGGEVIEEFPIQSNVEMLNIPGIKTAPKFDKILITDEFSNVE